MAALTVKSTERPGVTPESIFHMSLLAAASMAELGSSRISTVGFPNTISQTWLTGVRPTLTLRLTEKGNGQTEFPLVAAGQLVGAARSKRRQSHPPHHQFDVLLDILYTLDSRVELKLLLRRDLVECIELRTNCVDQSR